MSTKEKNNSDNKILRELSHIARHIEDLFILGATSAGIPKEEIRDILRINKNRIGRISKHIKPLKKQ